MKKIFTFIILTLFLTSFVLANSITSKAIENEEGKDAQGNQISEQTGTKNQTQARILTQTQIQKIKQIRNRIRIQAQEGECPENCICTGSTTKCQINEGREMTIRAGNSGNTIIQVKGINASTKVALYKSEDKFYGVFKNNKTRIINFLPDQVKEKIRERIKRKLENQTIELDENGIYQVQGRKRARLFFIFLVRERVRAEVNSETGEIIRIRNPWWGFLAKDEVEESE